jgi:hypothetical protein
MTGKIVAAIGVLAMLSSVPQAARAFPLGFSAVGGIGAGYYSMAEMNRHIGLVAQDRKVGLDGIASGVNFRIEGRIWILIPVPFALTGGYEHFWGDTEATGSETTMLSYRAPSDVYTIGAIVVVLRIENVFDLCVGANECFASGVYGTNELVERRLSEFKGKDQGYEAYAEVHTNFLNPIEVGMQLGYRGLTIDTFKSKSGDVGFFETNRKIEIDYSGAFFYLTTGIRL